MSGSAQRRRPVQLDTVNENQTMLRFVTNEDEFHKMREQITKDRELEAIMIETYSRDQGKTIAIRHLYVDPTSPANWCRPVTEIRHQSANQNRSYTLDANDDEALNQAIASLRRLHHRNAVLRQAVDDGITPWFGFIVHPMMLLFADWQEHLFAETTATTNNISYKREGHVLTGELRMPQRKMTLNGSKRMMNIGMGLPATTIASLRGRRLSELVDHPIAELIGIEKAETAQYWTTNGKGEPSVSLTLKPSWARLQRIPEAYKGDWAEITKTVDDKLAERAAKKRKLCSV